MTEAWIANGLCRHAMAEANAGEDGYDLPRETSIEERQQYYANHEKFLKEKYGRPCVYLGPEEGAFYSHPYCRECLEEYLKALEDWGGVDWSGVEVGM